VAKVIGRIFSEGFEACRWRRPPTGLLPGLIAWVTMRKRGGDLALLCVCVCGGGAVHSPFSYEMDLCVSQDNVEYSRDSERGPDVPRLGNERRGSLSPAADAAKTSRHRLGKLSLSCVQVPARFNIERMIQKMDF